MRFFLTTFGCKTNQYEAERIREALEAVGDVSGRLDEGQDYDVAIIHSCNVTNRALKRTRTLVRKAAAVSRYVIVSGCAAEHIKASDISRLCEEIITYRDLDSSRVEAKGVEISDIVIARVSNILRAPIVPAKAITRFAKRTRAFVKLQEGCDNNCSYCYVRIARGRAVERPFAMIKKEIDAIAANSIKEIVLTGTSLGQARHLVDVIRYALIDAKIPRVRLSSIEAKDITDELLELMSDPSGLCPHLHIPFQSGSDRILSLMERPYTKSEYISIVEKIRRRVPDAAISTDIMVGFPKETEQDFADTLELLDAVMPMRCHCFPYSPVSGTKAACMEGQIDMMAKKGRVDRVYSAVETYAERFKQQLVGRQCSLLIEEIQNGYGIGYTERYVRAAVPIEQICPKSPQTALNQIVNGVYATIQSDYILLNPLS